MENRNYIIEEDCIEYHLFPYVKENQKEFQNISELLLSYKTIYEIYLNSQNYYKNYIWNRESFQLSINLTKEKKNEGIYI